MTVPNTGGNVTDLQQSPPSTTTNGPVTTTISAPTDAPVESRFTADDIQKARQEEKDKVYSRLEQEAAQRKALEDQVAELLKSQKEREDAEAAARAAAEDQAKRKAEEEMSAKDLLAQREQELNFRLAETQSEWEQKFAQMQQEREQERAILQKEKELADLRAYTQQRVADEADNIAPQLRDFISGNSREEIEQSIDRVKAKSQEIANAAREAFQQARASQRGVAPTGYAPVGPMETEGGTRQYSAQDIQQMDMAEYAKLRQQIGLSDAGNNRGMYG